ncbi:hypothetical protein T440DRAFT_280337 [Plenodomus tracheiphilus IPT5]|uniref:Uncharacterized protein n=1 Tax=Plenodomus tracheiphilus IPT5 TaxID=1408161 RepID=A0A6A7ASR9_9PLEO|nr:hypothetical protein T440DRAFT_26645 [Plenodomus tracheiphilus IPT5]KAF2845289.1 hypothetical protein T440DRAFT_280337 [Plenodomus tracheiphilus IPT5]
MIKQETKPRTDDVVMLNKRLQRIEHCVSRIVQTGNAPAGVWKPVVKPMIPGAPPKILITNKKRDAERAFGNTSDERAKAQSANPDEERQRVFLAYRKVFTGNNALIRKREANYTQCSLPPPGVNIRQLNWAFRNKCDSHP